MMKGGELVKGSIDITTIIQNTVYEIDEERTNMLGVIAGRGFQGGIFTLKNDTSKVAKIIKIKNCTLSKETKEVVYLHIYASEIGIGPKTYGTPFITTDCSNVAFIMDKVDIYKPSPQDNHLLIELFTKSFNHHFVPFDFEYAKNIDGQLIFIDFGVCGIYSSYKEAVQKAIDNDLFLYNDFLRNHFLIELEKVGGGKNPKRKSKNKTKRKKNHRKNKKRTKTVSRRN